MRREISVAFALCLPACDDGVLRAFEPNISVIGGTGNAGSNPEPSAGAGAGAVAGAGGGAEAGSGSVIPTSPLLIDDFEDGDPRAKEPFGWWYPVNDETGTQGFGIEPVTRGTASLYALRTYSVRDFRDWGAAVGVNLMIGEAAPLNLQGYQQLCFVARVEAGASTSVQAHFLRGKLHYVRELALTETWSRYCLPLTEFVELDGTILPPSDILALQFFLPPKAPFVLGLDDVEITP
jgi:hypothetical protein